jgi:hypothetical protein
MLICVEFTDMIEDENLSASFTYIPDENVIKFNSNALHIVDYNMDYMFSHEISHRMDKLEYHSWENKKFLQTIESCSQKVYAHKEKVQ